MKKQLFKKRDFWEQGDQEEVVQVTVVAPEEVEVEELVSESRQDQLITGLLSLSGSRKVPQLCATQIQTAEADAANRIELQREE